MAEATLYFPNSFRWGTATSSHQVEGNNRNNDWWAWEGEPGRILNGHTTGLAFRPNSDPRAGSNDGLYGLDYYTRFLLSHLYQVWAALQQNIPVMGYHHWSLVDNFEWDRGWVERFGLIEMDPITQERQLRPSGELYGQICRGGRIDRPLVTRFAPELLDEMFPA